MAESPAFESPVVRSYATGDGSGSLVLSDVSATTKWLVRASADSATAERLQAPFGASVTAPGGALVMGSRPGEWIIIGSADVVGEAVAGLGAAGDDFVSVLDWTHGRALFRVTGSDAPRMLEKVCSLDWSDPMTPEGAVASASVAKVTCDIARSDADATASYLIFCDRSFGQYLFDALIDAGEEFGLVVGPAPAQA